MRFQAQPDDVIDGRYRLQVRLGRGGMGEVWRALDERLQRLVAVKLMGLGDPELVARFEREARAQARIDDDHVVKVHDTGMEVRGEWHVLYLVMEFLPGPTLADRIDQSGRFREKTAARYANEIAAGLAAAHHAGVVHRDVKPANLMFDAHSRLKLLDFGIAWETDSRGARLTGAGKAVGTAAYMSPEQATGSRVEAASDVYSLGCVLFEMLTGRWVFLAETRLELIVQRLHATAPRVSDLVPVPAHLDHLVATMLLREADRRPGLAQVRHVLTRTLEPPPPRPVASAPPAPPTPAPEPSRPGRHLPTSIRERAEPRLHRRLVVVAAAVVVVGLCGASYAVLQSIGGEPSAAVTAPVTSGPTISDARATAAATEANLLQMELTDHSLVDFDDSRADQLTRDLLNALAARDGSRAGTLCAELWHVLSGHPGFTAHGNLSDLRRTARSLNATLGLTLGASP